jgi:hypothetical protein
MNKSEFIKQLKETAEVLKPLTQSATPGGLTWDGAKYARSGERKPEPYALAWWSILTILAELIDRQETALSEKQIAYIDRLLFGGMGSFNDLRLDPNSFGGINKRLDEERQALYDTFKGA